MKLTLFDEPDALVVPSGAVFRSGNTDYVFVIENGHAVRRRVSVLYSASSDTVLSEEDGEVREGDIVIDQADTKGIYEGAAVR